MRRSAGFCGLSMKAPHRTREGDRSLGSRVSEGTPEGCKQLREQNPVIRRLLSA